MSLGVVLLKKLILKSSQENTKESFLNEVLKFLNVLRKGPLYNIDGLHLDVTDIVTTFSSDDLLFLQLDVSVHLPAGTNIYALAFNRNLYQDPYFLVPF